jgi:hypothetical protein
MRFVVFTWFQIGFTGFVALCFSYAWFAVHVMADDVAAKAAASLLYIPCIILLLADVLAGLLMLWCALGK